MALQITAGTTSILIKGTSIEITNGVFAFISLRSDLPSQIVYSLDIYVSLDDLRSGKTQQLQTNIPTEKRTITLSTGIEVGLGPAEDDALAFLTTQGFIVGKISTKE